MLENLNEQSPDSNEPDGLIPRSVFTDFVGDVFEGQIQIVYEDEYYVAVFKPAGLMVHRGRKTRLEEPVLLQTLRDQLGLFLYPIHRLDRPTAGLVIFAKSSSAAGKLAPMFADRNVGKYYQALVRGHIVEELLIDRPLSNQNDHNDVDDAQKVEQSAITHIRPLKRFTAPWPNPSFSTARFTLLEIQLHTGRWHQIRRHLNHIANPVIGDHRHGDHRWNQMFYERTGLYRMMLTSMRLDFRHPITQAIVSLLVSRGESFDRAIELLGEWQEH